MSLRSTAFLTLPVVEETNRFESEGRREEKTFSGAAPNPKSSGSGRVGTGSLSRVRKNPPRRPRRPPSICLISEQAERIECFNVKKKKKLQPVLNEIKKIAFFFP